MRSMAEMQRDIDQFDFRLIREKRVKKMDGGGLVITHLPTDSIRQHEETRRFVAFAERNWSVREIVLAASFHPAGTFHPHEDKDALTTRTRIEGTKDGCFVETREPTVVSYAGFGFATWEEAKAFDKALRDLHHDALMLLGACAALGLHGADFRLGFVRNGIDAEKEPAFDATIAQLRREVAEAAKKRAQACGGQGT